MLSPRALSADSPPNPHEHKTHHTQHTKHKRSVDDSSDDANHTPDSSNLKLSSSHLNGNVSTTNAANAANANTTPPTTFLGKMYASPFWRAATAGVNHDVHRPIEDEARVREIHESAEVFDDKAEMSFKYLQVMMSEMRCVVCDGVGRE